MNAVVYHEFGGFDKLKIEDVPVPEPKENQVLVKIAGLGLNPVDFKILHGHLPDFAGPFPIIPGFEMSGTVEKVGTGVMDFQVGDKVYGSASRSMAEYAVATTNGIALAPPSLDLPDAGTVPGSALTAYQALFEHGNLQEGQRVLIHAAAGGVGSFAVQLAKWKGAYVIGTGSGSSEHFVRELGADEFIDYKSQKFDEMLDPVDLVLDTIGGETGVRSEKILKPGGILVALTGQPDQSVFDQNGKTAKYMSAKPSGEMLKAISDLIEDLQVRVVVSGQVHFANVGEGLELLEGGHVRGKLLCLP